MPSRAKFALASLILLAPLPALAQPGLPPRGPLGRPDLGGAASNVNARHERAKTEAQEAYQKGDFDHALELIASVLNENPRDDVALYLRSSVRVEKGRREQNPKLIR